MGAFCDLNVRRLLFRQSAIWTIYALQQLPSLDAPQSQIRAGHESGATGLVEANLFLHLIVFVQPLTVLSVAVVIAELLAVFGVALVRIAVCISEADPQTAHRLAIGQILLDSLACIGEMRSC